VRLLAYVLRGLKLKWLATCLAHTADESLLAFSYFWLFLNHILFVLFLYSSLPLVGG
jgi:hypothetical protein